MDQASSGNMPARSSAVAAALKRPMIGAAAAGERARLYEAAVLKTLGATRGRILLSFALRSALLGAAAGIVAILAGGLAAWLSQRLGVDVGTVAP
jgi:putative ABC transport system permease protein